MLACEFVGRRPSIVGASAPKRSRGRRTRESRTLVPRGICRYIQVVLFASAVFLSTPTGTFAQLGLQQQSQQQGVTSAFLERQRALDRENQAKMEEVPVAQRFRVDYGGWFNSYFFLFDDGVNSSRTLRQNEMRLWMSFSADRGIHEGYLRMRSTYNDWNHGDSFTPNEDDLDGPNLERGWYVMDIAKALRIYGDPNTPYELKFKIGRDLVSD